VLFGGAFGGQLQVGARSESATDVGVDGFVALADPNGYVDAPGTWLTKVAGRETTFVTRVSPRPDGGAVLLGACQSSLGMKACNGRDTAFLAEIDAAGVVADSLVWADEGATSSSSVADVAAIADAYVAVGKYSGSLGDLPYATVEHGFTASVIREPLTTFELSGFGAQEDNRFPSFWSVAIDTLGLVIAGDVVGDIALDEPLEGDEHTDAVVGGLDPEGWIHRWSTSAQGAASATRVRIDCAGNVVAAGIFGPDIDIGGQRLVGEGVLDIFVVKLVR
jgi:hypothetical protein